MKRIATVLSELTESLVDDLGFTVTILAWIALGVLLPHLGLAAAWAAPPLFLGCAAILLKSVRRAAHNASRDVQEGAGSAQRSQRT